MKISDRFLDYGLIGGFFLTIQVILLMHFFPHIWPSIATIAIPSALQGSVDTILAALGIVAIFFTGALLDLFTVFYAYEEMYEIRTHLILNKDWLQATIIKSYDNLNNDLVTLCILQDDTDKLEGKAWLQDIVKKRSERTLSQHIQQLLKDKSWSPPEKRELVQTCQRLVAFFHSYIFTHSEASQLEMLVDRMHLWQTIRAFSTSITILCLELIVFIWLQIISSPLHDPLQQIAASLFMSLILIPIIILYAKYIICRAFSRVCMTLFSLVYLVSKKQFEEI